MEYILNSKEIILQIFLFGIIILSLFSVHFIYLYNIGHTDKEYLYALIVLFPASLIVGYIFITQLMEAKNRYDRKMEHLIREVLHEINLPISTIDANATMLRSNISDTKNLKRIDRIQKSLKRLQKLYSELAYNIKKDIMPIQKEEFDIKEIIEESISYFEEMQRNKIITDLEHIIAYGDKIGFMQVIDNIIENAFKYSEIDQPIVIKLKHNILSIEDSGIGMDENEILKVYERYYQGNSESAGEGIGLAIVKRYCDDEGITLKIESQKGIGTKVVMELENIISV